MSLSVDTVWGLGLSYHLLDTWTGAYLTDTDGAHDYNYRYAWIFDTRQEAHEAIPEGSARGRIVVSFVLKEYQRSEWHQRMRLRFRDGSYQRLPCPDLPVDLNITSLALDLHFPHMSNKQAGNIAYTPSEEAGHLDRQVSLTPARYLDRFYAGVFSQKERDRFIAACQQVDDSRKVKFAITADDIERVYTTPGPSSCMAKDASDFRSCCHPVRVYGDSDLQVAYIGRLQERISARSVVWPERKTFVRTYGANDLMLAELECLKYSRAYNFDGAHVRLIERDEGIVMPYIDGCDGASVSRTRRGFVRLGSGPISTTETNGLGTENETTYRSCDRCGGEYDTEDADATGDYCAGCAPYRAECAQCSRGIWTDTNDVFEYGDSHLCGRCHREHGNECVRCSETWYSFDFGTRERQSRRNANQDSMCADCANDGWIECAECGENCQPYDDVLVCSDCAESSEEPIVVPTPRCEHTADLLQAATPRIITSDTTDIRADMVYTLVRIDPAYPETLHRCYMDRIGPLGPLVATVSGVTSTEALALLFEQEASLARIYPQYRYRVIETLTPIPEVFECPGFEVPANA